MLSGSRIENDLPACIAHCHVHNQLVDASLLSIRAQKTIVVTSRQSRAHFHHLGLLYLTTMSMP